MKKHFLLLAILLIIFSTTLHAKQRWFQVEVLIFSQGQANSTEEAWPQNILLSYPDEIIRLKSLEQARQESLLGYLESNSDGTSQIPKETLQPDYTYTPHLLLPYNQLTMLDMRQKLERSAAHQLLFHHAWRQAVLAKDKASSILIQGGSKYDDHYELEGSIHLSLKTYLHIETHLWYSVFERYYEGMDTNNTVALPLSPEELLPQAEAVDLSDTIDNWEQENFYTNELTGKDRLFINTQTVLFQHDRRMRSKELHYLDHPLMGLLIRITKFNSPYDEDEEELKSGVLDNIDGLDVN